MSVKNFKNVLGPGILFASTAIGVSHLVQSTRAGAEYGFALVWVIFAANIFKYPFFEFASRYANATGESLIDGYKRMGTWVLWVYVCITIASMFFVVSAVGFVTVGFMDNLLGLSSWWPSFSLFPTLLLFVLCILILIYGKYSTLDKMIKIIGIVLLFSTLLAFVLTVCNGSANPVDGFIPPTLGDNASILFIIALMGWMPTAVDLSTWNSLWTVEKIKSSGYHPSLKETLFEFNTGYWVAAGLSFLFLTLGAYLMYGTGIELSNSSVGFSAQIIQLYTTSIGSWSFLIIAAASFSIMFGTCIAVFDGYARVLERCYKLLQPSQDSDTDTSARPIYTVSLLVLSAGGFLIIALFLTHFKMLIDLATTISFLIAPFIAFANLYLVQKCIPVAFRPPTWLRILAYLGLVFLVLFAGYFLYIPT